MSVLVVRGDIRALKRRTDRQRSGRPANSSISTDFRVGNGSSALARTNTDRTLGASTRKGWRLSCGAVERAAHNARTTRNDAAYVGVSEPIAYVVRDTNKRVRETDRL